MPLRLSRGGVIMSERAYRERLEADLARWQADGLLPPKSADAIRATLRPVPEGITIETPSQTEIVIKGIDRQKVGQVAAEIRDVRPPEPYKGKGVRIVGERVRRKEGKTVA